MPNLQANFTPQYLIKIQFGGSSYHSKLGNLPAPISYQQLSMKTQSLDKGKNHTENTAQHSTNMKTERSDTRDLPKQLPTLSTKTFSFQDLGSQSVSSFCSRFQHLHALLQVGKRITDPNVLLMNSTQKEIVEMIIENNKHSNDDKSKYIKQKASKYLKILWKSEKYNDSMLEKPVKVQREPHYATPIHNFKKHKLTDNNSFGSQSNRTEGSKDSSLSRKKDPVKKEKEKFTIANKPKRNASQDHKFEHIRLSPRDKIRRNKEVSKEKSFEIDLTNNIAWKTMATTKNFENMLKILKKEQ